MASRGSTNFSFLLFPLVVIACISHSYQAQESLDRNTNPRLAFLYSRQYPECSENKMCYHGQICQLGRCKKRVPECIPLPPSCEGCEPKLDCPDLILKPKPGSIKKWFSRNFMEYNT